MVGAQHLPHCGCPRLLCWLDLCQTEQECLLTAVPALGGQRVASGLRAASWRLQSRARCGCCLLSCDTPYPGLLLLMRLLSNVRLSLWGRQMQRGRSLRAGKHKACQSSISACPNPICFTCARWGGGCHSIVGCSLASMSGCTARPQRSCQHNRVRAAFA